MAKRRSERQLNKDEPDNVDDEPEDSGEFQKAAQSEMATRKIATAKRRLPENTGPSPLANFAGFVTAPSSSPFSLFQKSKSETTETQKDKINKTESVKSLNLSFLEWIKEHLDKNPYVNLVPVFRDYEKHLSSLNLNSQIEDQSTVKVTSTPPFSFSTLQPKKPETSTTEENKVPTFNFGLKKPETSTTEENKVPTFNFGLKKPETSTTEENKVPTFNFAPKTAKSDEKSVDNNNKKSGFTFGLIGNKNESSKPLFSFGQSGAASEPSKPSFNFFNSGSDSSKPEFSKGTGDSLSALANAEPPAAPEKPEQEGEEESDEPPVSDFVPVAEEGSVFDIRCKLFENKDGKFQPIGVGKLYLKELPSGKTQAIARADTTQGNILLNVILTPEMPIVKKGKNNVLIVCIPKPDSKPPPVPILIRVKGTEEQTQLYDHLEKLKK